MFQFGLVCHGLPAHLLFYSAHQDHRLHRPRTAVLFRAAPRQDLQAHHRPVAHSLSRQTPFSVKKKRACPPIGTGKLKQFRELPLGLLLSSLLRRSLLGRRGLLHGSRRLLGGSSLLRGSGLHSGLLRAAALLRRRSLRGSSLLRRSRGLLRRGGLLRRSRLRSLLRAAATALLCRGLLGRSLLSSNLGSHVSVLFLR